ncbi:MAG: thiamine phosphate synthase [Nitrospinota bacterium]|jgi:thiamine-phosphate pyrophosphorylase|nr:thiamine phosphate synthase [Nitrospinota bacterium]HJM43234.1 thiamine phosphate synthase [Nitrospinota bacterium]
MNLPRLYLITDRNLVPGGDLEAAVEAALRGGAKLIQLREKDLSGGAMLSLAESVLVLTRKHRARLLINDRVGVAAAVGADGAHLGSRGIPIREARTILGEKAILGYSAHTMEEAQMAGRLGADLVTLGPIFPTRKEFSAPLLGLDGLQFACAELTVPVYALGGINAGNAAGAIEAGAAGVASISSVFADPDPEARARELIHLLGGKEASTPFIRKWLRYWRKG